MSKRRILIGAGIAAGALVLANIFALIFYLPRVSRSNTAKSEATPAPETAPAVRQNAVPARIPLAAGAIVQREELSSSGNLRLKYVRSKGNPVRQIVLERVDHPGEPKVFFEYQRNAWILVSPNDEWIALNNRPSAGHSEVQLYHHDGPGPLDYAVSEDTRDPGAELHQAVWKYYLQELGLPAETPSDGVAIDAVGWDPSSKQLTLTVTVSQADADDNVPPPWSCVLDLETKELEVPPEAAAAFNGQQGQTEPIPPGAANASPAAQSNVPLLQGDFTGERYPETRSRAVTAEEVSNWSLTNIRYAIEEIYARRGASFDDDPEVRKRFSKFPWYQPRPGISDEQIKNELSDVEKQNLTILEKKRASHHASSGSKSKAAPPLKIGEKIKNFFKGK